MNGCSNFLKRLLFPQKCLFCGEQIPSGYCCENCVPSEPIKKIINIKPINKFLIISSPNLYTGEYRNSLLKYKFRGKRYFAELFAMLICDKIKISSDYLITWVPMTKNGVKNRGYNQSQEMAKVISKITGNRCCEVLIKSKDNKAQHSLSGKERQRNVKGVFSVVGDIKGQKILLIDDILTTGATVSECSRILYEAGANDVTCICAASADNID